MLDHHGRTFYWKVVLSRVDLFEKMKRVPIIQDDKKGLKVENVGQCHAFGPKFAIENRMAIGLASPKQ